MRLFLLLLLILGCFISLQADEWSKARRNAKEWYIVKSDLRPSSSINLKWTPEKSRQDYYQRKIFDQVPMIFNFDSILVNRSDSYLIGINIEDSLRKISLYTSDSIDQWMKLNLNRLMDEQISTAAGYIRETYLVCGTPSKFLVTESSVYLCTLSIDVKVKDAKEKIIWEGRISENSASWGRSFKAFVYQEVLSTALQNWFYSFANNKNMLDVVGRDISEKWKMKINCNPVSDGQN
jgi:hypothetical protein